jgi:hypothetical protein
MSEFVVESSWNVMAHGDAREGKWRGNWRMEWVASTFYITSENPVSSITTADARTLAASSRVNWCPADLNGVVCSAESQNLVSVRVPLCFNWSVTRRPVCTDFGGTVTVLYTLKCCAPQNLILATKCPGFLIFMDTLHSNSAYEQWGRMCVGTGQP